jgi:REP element-mobilizing transposase RayT
MLRGINRATIFHDDEDCEVFLAKLNDVRREYPFSLYAWCLMGNHVHLLLDVSEQLPGLAWFPGIPSDHDPNKRLSSVLKRLGVRYVIWYNHKYQRIGHLFQDRFRSVPVESDQQFLAAYRYILRNPVKAGLCTQPEQYPWSGSETDALPLSLSPQQLSDFLHEPGVDDPNPFPEHLTDREAEALIRQTAGVPSAAELSLLPREQLVPTARSLLEQGVTVLQLARLSGISRSNLVRWLK